MKYLFALISITLLLVSSCKKEEIETPQTVTSNYMPLAIGNYWVYQEFQIDSLGNETPMPNTDSMYVANDTVIGQNTYSVIRGSFFPYGFSFLPDNIVMIIRDSSGFMVNHIGYILYASEITPDTLDKGFALNLGDTMNIWYQIMDQNTHTISVPAGSFTALDCKTHNLIYPQSPNPIKQVNHRYISENVGIIIETWGYSAQSAIGTYFEKRLIRYHIQE